MNARMVGIIGAMVVGVGAPGAPGQAGGADESGGEGRPGVAALHLGEADVLAGFTPEVRSQAKLRARALALWRTHFSAQAAALRARFTQEADWRPALADAAALLDDFLEASLLPRARQWSAGEDQVWVEKLDVTTGQRTRTLQTAAARPVILAPEMAPRDQRLRSVSPNAQPPSDADGVPTDAVIEQENVEEFSGPR